MRNIKVVIEYDGTQYQGYQFQPGVPTIQGELERVLAGLVKEPVTVYGAGRTDSGVHALGQVISFRSNCTIPIDKLCVAMNSRLSDSISAVSAEEVDDDFHARFSAVRRVYRYNIMNTELRCALVCRYAWHVSRLLDEALMNEAAQALVGLHDFRGFSRGMHETKTTVRRVYIAEVNRTGDVIGVEIAASGFLRSMVRVIIGVLVEIGSGSRPVSDILDILKCAETGHASITAPPQGLCLVRVDY